MKTSFNYPIDRTNKEPTKIIVYLSPLKFFDIVISTKWDTQKKRSALTDLVLKLGYGGTNR